MEFDFGKSQLGFGAWGVGGKDWTGESDQAESERAVVAAIEGGVTFFDTAPTYGDSERLLGKVLAPYRDQVTIATKFGPSADPAGSLAESLSRMQLESIDLFQMHEVGAEFETSLDKLEGLQQEGKVAATGLCNATKRQLSAALKRTGLSTYQAAYNLFDRDVEYSQLPVCVANHLGLLAYRPLASGALTDKFSREWVDSFDTADHRLGIYWFKGKELERRLAVVEELRKIAVEGGRSVSELALGWVLSRPGVSVVLAGARTVAQVKENMRIVDNPLQQDEFEAIEQAVKRVFRPARATRTARAAAQDWDPRERFIVDSLDGATAAEAIAAKWSDRGESSLIGAQVKVFIDQLADEEMVSFE